MQAQDTTETWLFNLWPWLEANAKRLAYGAAIILIAVFVISFYSWRQSQKEIAAGNALTALTVNGGQPETYLKIAADYPGTHAGQRAQLQGAVALFAAGRYAEAQVQFQKFLDAYPDNAFSGQAMLGVASSINAQGKTELAVSAYQRAANQSTDGGVVAAAKFALAQIDEQQGNFSDAQKLYEDVTHALPNGSIGSEAGLHLVALRTKVPATAAPASSAMPFNLSH